ncbi:RNA polymerase sigma factor [Enhygromyxa salina]|uniref:RNA polymerase sigma factor YlaC n=1 Tax=Enhygromyxa salina TaxID=215803 RepID=A0A2S9Y7R8_9BACT|nr:sigma-70 family RNA polymerase sigma factor [Enhygromyxa salina]PRQ01154.1 RNA polymerase sigma factor YlaC [Enhygromyxa salina]
MHTDAELLAAWAAGDTLSGSRLFDRHYSSVYRFFANKLPGPSEIEDLVQQTFMACIESRARYRGDASFRTFLFGIARNILLRYLRDARKHSVDVASTSLADCGLGVTSVLHLRREQQLLLTALRHIPIDSQVVLEMSYWEQMPAREIGEALNESEAAIRGRLRKAKLELRGAVEGLARTRSELDSTLDGLEQWAEGVRAFWDAR